MSLWHIAWNYLWNRKLTTVVTILCVALGVGLISAVLTLRKETQRRFEEEGQSFDIVVGAKGSPLQLVLSTVYFVDTPTGNIRYDDFLKIREDEDVENAYPLGLGDTYKGFRIVGTEAALFDYEWKTTHGELRKPFHIAEGRVFDKPMEAVLGSLVAQQAKLKLGDEFAGTHGFIQGAGDVHEHAKYKVVGILEPSDSPTDRVVFCTLDSVWEVHKHEETDAAPEHEKHEEHEGLDDHEHHEEGPPKEVTAVLVALESPALRFQFRDRVNDEYNAMAAIPVNEIANLYAELLGAAKTVLLAVGYLVVLVSALSILASLYLSILQRRRDMAIMRALGASPVDVFGAVLLEAFWVSLLGIASGWLLGNVVSWGLGLYLSKQFGMTITAFGITSEEVQAYAIVAMVGLLAGILPAWQAYRTDVASYLGEH